MSTTILEKKSKEVKVLDETTKELLASIEHKDSRRRFWSTVAFVALLVAILLSILYQFRLATQSKNHIDCIVKLFSTPIPKDSRTKFISDAYTTCNIRFQ